MCFSLFICFDVKFVANSKRHWDFHFTGNVLELLEFFHLWTWRLGLTFIPLIQGVSKPMSQTFPGYSPPPLKQNVPINMGPKVNRFRDIDLRSCAGIEYYVRCSKCRPFAATHPLRRHIVDSLTRSSWNASGNPWCDMLQQMVNTLNILHNTQYQHMNVSRYLGTCSLLLIGNFLLKWGWGIPRKSLRHRFWDTLYVEVLSVQVADCRTVGSTWVQAADCSAVCP
jgi:hypothetical protein